MNNKHLWIYTSSRRDWRLVKKNAFRRLRHLAPFFFWHRRAISEFLTEISISSFLSQFFPAWLVVYLHSQMSHAAMKPIRIRCCCCSCCGFVYCTPLERQQWGGGDTIVSTFHKTLTFPKAFLTWTTLLVKPKNYQIASDLALQYALLQSLVNVYKKEGGKTRKSLIEY